MENEVNLTGRIARCSCGREMPSSQELAFFEYRGAGSRSAEDICVCGYARVAHEQEDTRSRQNVVKRELCEGFRARGDVGNDTYYCGCRGWD